MEVIYNNVDITNDIKINKAVMYDICGGKADSLDIVFSDTEKKWREWAPKKNDTIVILKDGFSSGIMYIDELILSSSKYTIRARSTPLKSKSNKTKSWENIRFKDIAKELTNELGLQLETYGIQDYLYDRLDMLNKTNLQFLNEICILEGYSLKITNGKAIIYNEKELEKAPAVINISEELILGRDYEFSVISNGLYSSCEIDYFTQDDRLINYNYIPPNPPIAPSYKLNLRANSQSEAERYAKSVLRYFNKKETTGTFSIRLNTNIAAGNTINLDLNQLSGKYFISSIIQNLTSNRSYLHVRKVLEGY